MKKIAVGDLGEFWYGDYKEPFEQLEGAVPGHPVGVVLKDDQGLLLCAWCGKVYKNLGAHSAKTHGMSATQYKDEAGLLRKSALVSEQTRMMASARMLRMRAAGIMRNPTLEQSRLVAQKGGLQGGSGTRTPEALNKTGRCYAQVIATGRAVLRESGRVTQDRMRRRGVSSRIVESYFGSWANYVRAVGDNPARRSGIPWGKAELVTALRNLAIEVGHTPTLSDMKRYGIPSRITYERHFGSWGEACKTAGILPNVPGSWMAREITQQERVTILSAYAMSGRMDKTARSTHISEQRIKPILASFGILPLPYGAPMHQRMEQMELAATISRRLADLPEVAA